MILSITKTALFSLFFLLGVTGCMKVDTNPQPVFSQVQEDVAHLTNQCIYWDRCLQDSIIAISMEELLQKELSEDLAIQIALLNNQNLQAIYESLGIAKAKLAQAGMLKNPIFSFSYRFSTQSNVTDLIEGALLQNFLEILLIPLKRKMAQAELEATKAMLISKVVEMIAETKIAFYTLQASEQIWNLKKDILLASELSYEAGQRLFEAGNIKDLDLSIERSFYEQAKLDVASWEIAVLEAREKLHVLMGLWGCQIDWKISPIIPEIPSKEEDFINIENEAIARSFDLKISYNKLLATAASFGIDTSKFIFPQFDLGVSAEREDSIWYVGPAFNIAIPLFDFGKVNAAKAKAAIMQEWNRYTALAIEIRSKARISRFSLLNAFRQYQYLKKVMIPLSEQITNISLLQHNAMQLGIFQLLSAKQRELEKKVQFVQMRQEYLISKVILQSLLKGHILGKDVFMVPQRNLYE